MANPTPFSPFVGRNRMGKPDLKRRQSEVPSDLIDWDAPEIPELEKQRIIYEDYIRDCEENHEVETLINEEIYKVALETIVTESQRHHEEQISKERSKVNLLLGQIKMFEDNVGKLEEELTASQGMISNLEEDKENLQVEKTNLENQIEQLHEKEKLWCDERTALETTIKDLEKQKEDWNSDRQTLQTEIETLTFRNNEIQVDLNHKFEMYLQKKVEADDLKRKYEVLNKKIQMHKKSAKSEKA